MIPCKHWHECGILGGGCCTIDAYDKPSFGTCLAVCNKYEGPDRGNPNQFHAKALALTQIQRQETSPKEYLGTRLGKTIERVTGKAPCKTCTKVQEVIDAGHRLFKGRKP